MTASSTAITPETINPDSIVATREKVFADRIFSREISRYIYIRRDTIFLLRFIFANECFI